MGDQEERPHDGHPDAEQFDGLRQLPGGKRRIRDDDDGHQILKHRARGSVPILYAGKIRILHRQHAHESESDQFLRVPPVTPNGKDILPVEKQVQEQEQAPGNQQPGDDQPFRSEAAVLQQILPGDAAAAPHGGAHGGHQQPPVPFRQPITPSPGNVPVFSERHSFGSIHDTIFFKIYKNISSETLSKPQPARIAKIPCTMWIWTVS